MQHKVNLLSGVEQVWILNSDFSFSCTDFHTKVKEPSLRYYLPMAGFILSQRYKFNAKCKQPRPGFEFILPIPFSTTVAITQRVYIYIYIVIHRQTVLFYHNSSVGRSKPGSKPVQLYVSIYILLLLLLRLFSCVQTIFTIVWYSLSPKSRPWSTQPNKIFNSSYLPRLAGKGWHTSNN